MGSGMKGSTTEDNQVSLPEWRKKLIERVFSVQGSSEHNLGQTVQIVQYVKLTINLASSFCNTTGLLVLSVREI